MELHSVWQLHLMLIHEQCMTFWEETLSVSRRLTPDLVSQQRWSSGWCAGRLCTTALGYSVPLSPGAAGCVMALLPSGKTHWGLQLHYSWKNTTFHRLNQYSINCGCAMRSDPFKGWGGKAMFSPWDNWLTKASIWHFCNSMEREHYMMQLWKKKSGLQLCYGETKEKLRNLKLLQHKGNSSALFGILWSLDASEALGQFNNCCCQPWLCLCICCITHHNKFYISQLRNHSQSRCANHLLSTDSKPHRRSRVIEVTALQEK